VLGGERRVGLPGDGARDLTYTAVTAIALAGTLAAGCSALGTAASNDVWDPTSALNHAVNHIEDGACSEHGRFRGSDVSLSSISYGFASSDVPVTVNFFVTNTYEESEERRSSSILSVEMDIDGRFRNCRETQMYSRTTKFTTE